MTKISNQYSLTNILTADLANSRLGINNVSPTVALDVTGAGKFSGELSTTSGLISISGGGGAPPTGGVGFRTVTGRLIVYGGTSDITFQKNSNAGPNLTILESGAATFSSSVYASRALFDSDFLSNETSKVGIGFAGGYAQFNSWGANTSTYGGFKFQISVSNGGTFDALKIASSGASTFASSVTIGSALNHSLSVGLNQPTTDTLNQIFAGQAAFGGQAAGGETDIGNNWYYYSGFKYRITAPSSNIKLNGDVISFERAASGTANAAIPFAESMRITSGGNVCIGTTTAQDARLTLSYAGGVDWAVGPKSGTSSFAIIGSTGGGGGVYLSNGGTSWAAWSDRRVKKNIEDLEYGLDKILSISPVRFDYLTDEGDNSSRIGFIAQDVQEQMPEIVNYAYEDILGMSSTDLIPVLVKAIQELSAEITLLENK